jgi:hypothetical protein
MSIELAGRRVGGDIGVGAGHLALFFTNAAGDEFILSAYTDNNLFSGDLNIETYEGSAWVPRQVSSENIYPPDLFDRVVLDFKHRDPEEVARIIDQFAQAINDQEFDYSVLSQNSNSVIGTLLDLVGIKAEAVLPNPPDVGWLGFVAAEDFLKFPFEIQGSTGGDFIQGREFGQTFEGGNGDDTLYGGAGADTLNGGVGDDVIDGGGGIDTAVFDAPQTAFTLTLSPDQTTITDRRADGLGIDQLNSIKFLDFEQEIEIFDSPMNLDAIKNSAVLLADELSAIVELYIAYFNRAPDAIGLNYWATEFTKGFTLPEMAMSFFVQNETRATYASVLDDAFNLNIADRTKVGDFITEVYDNVLGRAPDMPGFNYWVNELETNPDISPGIFILAILNGAKFPSEPTALTAIDQIYLSNKVDLGVYFSVIKGMSDVADASGAMALFTGTQISIDETVAAIDGHYADALVAETGDFLMQLVGVIDDPFMI